MTRKQCKLCPWKTSTDPMQIPGGYSVEMHSALARTIAEPGRVPRLGESLRLMACHETCAGKELPCVGWLDNQVNEGNNIALRLAVVERRVSLDYELDGPQHTCLEDTLPKQARLKRKSR